MHERVSCTCRVKIINLILAGRCGGLGGALSNGAKASPHWPQARSTFSATSTAAAELSTFFVAVFRLLAASSNCLKDARSMQRLLCMPPERFRRPRFARTPTSTAAPVTTIPRRIGRSTTLSKGNAFCIYPFRLKDNLHQVSGFRTGRLALCLRFRSRRLDARSKVGNHERAPVDDLALRPGAGSQREERDACHAKMKASHESHGCCERRALEQQSFLCLRSYRPDRVSQ
jgi:hypothetical protein